MYPSTWWTWGISLQSFMRAWLLLPVSQLRWCLWLKRSLLTTIWIQTQWRLSMSCLLTWVLFLMSMNIASVTQRYVSLEKCWKRSWWHLLNPKMILVPLMLLHTGWKWFLPKQAKRVLGDCLFPGIRLSRMNLVACRDWVSSCLPTVPGHLPLSLLLRRMEQFAFVWILDGLIIWQSKTHTLFPGLTTPLMLWGDPVGFQH